MKHPFRISLTPWFLILIIGMPTSAQETEEGEDSIKTITEITENSDQFEGLFTLYRDRETGEAHMEITREQLDQEFIYVAVSTDGVVQGGHFRGRYRDNRILSLARHFNKIEIRSENTSFYFNPENPLSRAAHANISPGLLVSESIVAEDDETGTVLINVDEIFASETLLQVKATPDPDETPEDAFRLGDLSEDKSKITEIRNYPLNSDVHVEYVYENLF